MRRKWSLVGLADDTGVFNIGGRIGSMRGPTYFRRSWMRMSGVEALNATMEDMGDWKPDAEATPETLKESHQRASLFVGSAHRKTGLSIVVGGGHDLGYPHLLGIRDALLGGSKRFQLGCINLDAHLDVRKPNPKITSGSPFYLALESGLLEPKNFVEFGIQSHCNSTELFRYVKEKKITVIPYSDLRFGKAYSKFKKELSLLAKRVDAIVISLDLDCIAEAYAPGVSAPQPEGFHASEMMAMLECAGAQKKCVSLGIFELNPLHDREEQTCRLAAVAAQRFLSPKSNH